MVEEEVEEEEEEEEVVMIMLMTGVSSFICCLSVPHPVHMLVKRERRVWVGDHVCLP